MCPPFLFCSLCTVQVVRRANGVRAHVPGDSVTDKLSHRQVTGTLFWLGTLSSSFWDSSQSYWDKRAGVLILRREMSTLGGTYDSDSLLKNTLVELFDEENRQMLLPFDGNSESV
jgi:hypothetical protein